MKIGFDQEQTQFREVVSRFLRERSPIEVVRALMETEQGFDAELWKQTCGEVGLAGIHIPEEYGGAGFGPVELGIVLEEMGRSLYCGPFFSSSVMAGFAILEYATPVYKEELLPGIAEGTQLATLVLDNLDSPAWVGQQFTVVADGDSVHLTGRAEIVVDAHLVDVFIVPVYANAKFSLYKVSSREPGVTVAQRPVMDLTRKLSSVSLKNASATLISGASDVDIHRIWDFLSSMLAHEMVGGAQTLLESTVEFTKTRVQFGRQIGSFQSLKHICADLLHDIELAKAATYHSARCLAGDAENPSAANMAKAMASDAYMDAAKAAIQLRGGIGFTWEEDTHLWFKRAKSSEVFLGTSNWHRQKLVERKLEEMNA